MVAKEWASISVETALWRYGRIRSVVSKLFMRVGRNQSSTYKKEKEGLSNIFIIDFLDQKAKTCLLTTIERDALKAANLQLSYLRRDDEIKWVQRANVNHVQEGGNNTKYFHLIANGNIEEK
jgi:hypothetical protein